MASEARGKVKLAPLQEKRLLRRTRALQVQNHPRLRAPRHLPARPPPTVGARARNRCLKPIGIIGTSFSPRKKSDNSSGAGAFRRALRSCPPPWLRIPARFASWNISASMAGRTMPGFHSSDLEPRRTAHEGLPYRGDRRPALLVLLHRGRPGLRTRRSKRSKSPLKSRRATWVEAMVLDDPRTGFADYRTGLSR